MSLSRFFSSSVLSLLAQGPIYAAGATVNSQEIDKYWNYSQPAVSEAIFHKLSRELEGLERLEVMTQVARAQGLQGQFDKAHQTLDAIQRELENANPVIWTRYLLERGRVLNSAGHQEMALPLFKQALSIAEAAKLDFYAVDAAHMLGIATPPADQLEWNRKAILLAEKSVEARVKDWLGSLYNNQGWAYHDLKQYQTALSLFERNVKWHEAKQSKKGLIIAKWSVARTLRSLARFEEALAIQQENLAKNQALKLSEDGYIYEEIGENLLALNRASEAKPYFAKAYQLLSQDRWLQKNESQRLQRLKSLL